MNCAHPDFIFLLLDKNVYIVHELTVVLEMCEQVMGEMVHFSEPVQWSRP